MSLLKRISNYLEDPPARVIAAIAPDLSELSDPGQVPAVVAAESAYRAAGERIATLSRERDEWAATVVQLDEAGSDIAALEEAETKLRTLGRELRWAGFARSRAENDLAAARKNARSEMAGIALRLLGEAQLSVYDRARDLVAANQAVMRTMERVEGLGFRLGRGFEQIFPCIDAEMVARWRANAQWAPHAQETGPDLRIFAEVIVRRHGGAPIQGVSPGEHCWIPKSEINRLLKARAIEIVGAPEGVFVPPAPPDPGIDGLVAIKFVTEYVVQISGGVWRRWEAGDLDRVTPKIAWEAVVDQAAEYAPEGAIEPALYAADTAGEAA